MALKKFRDPSVLLYHQYMCEPCIVCHEEKMIPLIRPIKKCDECFEKDWDEFQTRQKKIEDDARIKNQRIPERYRNFDISKLEIPKTDFEDLCRAGRSLSISGEVGTGKTNLACQIIIHRRSGVYYSVNELFKSKIDKVMDSSCLVIDDISKLNTTDQKKMEAFFELINYRYSESRDTIITIDRTYEELERLFGDYGQALVSRLRSWMIGIVLTRKFR
jgi:DNA replication protein DnaC